MLETLTGALVEVAANDTDRVQAHRAHQRDDRYLTDDPRRPE